ncbi:MAG TPA: DUF2666 family protein [Candidatus Acidoferrum sp.]|nr:DUF2666 family protein [Candidatus Acidoferrum sp.]
MAEDEDYVDFMAKYKDWISIKRLGIKPNTKPEEIVFHLAGIRNTIDMKSFPMLGIKTAPLDAEAARAAGGKKKKFKDLGAAVSELESSSAKHAVEQAVGGAKELAPLAWIYLLGKVISTLDYDASINQKTMSKIFPDLKIKKPLGRQKKQSD